MMPRSRKKKIDDYITVPEKKHEDESYIKDMAFSAVRKISVKNSMPVYEIDDISRTKKEQETDNNRKIRGMPVYETPVSEERSNEEE